MGGSSSTSSTTRYTWSAAEHSFTGVTGASEKHDRRGGAGAGAGAGARARPSGTLSRNSGSLRRSHGRSVGRHSGHEQRPATTTSGASIARVLEPGEAKENIELYYDVPQDVNRLGRGHYGLVHEGMERGTGVKVAVKTIQKARIRNIDMIRNEIRILRKLRHPNIIKLYDVFESDEEVKLVTELCTGGELFERIQQQQRYDERSASILIKTVLMAVDHCHSNNIVHRDLKPENFLFTHPGEDGVLKVIDFGLSCGFEDNVPLTSRVGTPYYIAPEVLDKSYSCECDIWSVGVILYILLCGYPPFWGDRDQDIFRKVRKGVVSFASAEWASVSGRAKELVAGLLTSNPKERLTAREALQHPWIVAEGGQHVRAISSSLLMNMHKFTLAKKLKQLALNLIVMMVDDGEIMELEDVYRQVTRQFMRPLSLERFHGELKSCGYTTSVMESRVLMKALNISGSGQISLREFCAACLRRPQYLAEPVLYDAFTMLDVDSTGYVDADNIQQVMDISPEAAELVVDEADVDEDGRISYAEFLRAMFAGGSPS